MRLTVFKTSKPKGFDFKPRYYNPEKEEFEHRVQSIKADYAREQGNDVNVSYSTDAVRSRIRSNWNAVSSRKQANKASNMRILIIAAVLSVGLYLFLFTDIFSI